MISVFNESIGLHVHKFLLFGLYPLKVILEIFRTSTNNIRNQSPKLPLHMGEGEAC